MSSDSKFMVMSLFGAGILSFIGAGYFSQQKGKETEVKGGLALCGIFILLATIMGVKNKKKFSTSDGLNVAVVVLAVLTSWYMAYETISIYAIGSVTTIAILSCAQLNYAE